jgi:hypothetical protein
MVQVEEMTVALGATFLGFQNSGLQLDDKWLLVRGVELAARLPSPQEPGLA